MSEAVDFLNALKPWREPTWGVVSNNPNPKLKSFDNPLLFTATALVRLYGLVRDDAKRLGMGLQAYYQYYPNVKERIQGELASFTRFVRACEDDVPGRYKRWPGDDKGPTTHDDLTGVAVASYLWGLPHGEEILNYVKTNHWIWHKDSIWRSAEARKNYLYLPRIPDFTATIRVCGKEKPGLVEQWFFKQALHANNLEGREHTSGKCLIYLKAKVVEHQSLAMDQTILQWRATQQQRYPKGMKDVYEIYFSKMHPLTVFAPTNFV